MITSMFAALLALKHKSAKYIGPESACSNCTCCTVEMKLVASGISIDFI